MTTVISVRFRSGCKTYFFDPGDVQVQTGDHVIVETAQGLEYAQCTMGNHPVDDCCVIQPLRPLVRVATENDRRTAAPNPTRVKEAFDICQRKILQHNLEMKLVRVECSFEGNKILFFFTADGRVDFRELVKDLASVFRARIELRQIGVRDEAKMLGGLGICGRPFCCAQFLDDFVPVSIKMAKTQSLSLLKEPVHVRLDEKPEAPRCYHSCELCVLRNGKGSRDGIQVPQERPARYVEERKEDEFPMPLVIADFDPDAPAREERPARRRNERRRRGGGSKPQQTAEKVPEKREKPRPPEKKRPDGPRADDKPRRPRRKPGDKPQENRPQPPKGGAPKPSQQPAEHAAPQEGAQSPRRPRHRGGRRRSGGGGTPAAEG